MAKPVLAVTTGDPAGVGPELIRQVLQLPEVVGAAEWKVIGPLQWELPGQPDSHSAKAALEALEEAVRMGRAGKIDGMVTGPVCKATLAERGFLYPGQTEFLADRFEVPEVAMILTGEHLTVGLATIHLSLADALARLDQESIVRAGRLLAGFCQARGWPRPSIAVAGLNPHAGEQGRFGDEEAQRITPAIAQLQEEFRETMLFSGPHSPDVVFRAAAEGRYQAVLAMYHDQGLIPFKLLDFDSGVNVTYGLPVIRTSPDHGTAFDIAGKGVARPGSMRASFLLAAALARRSLEEQREVGLPG